MAQDLVVLAEETGFQVRTAVTGEKVFESEVASEAIEKAIDTVAGGGSVTLGRGCFPVAAPILLTHQLRLAGAGRGTRLVAGEGFKGEALVIADGANGVEVCDLALDGGGNGPASSGVLLSGAADCEVHAIFARRFPLYGIWMRNSSALCRVRGCSLAGNAGAGIYLDGLERGEHGDFIPNLVSDCTVYGGAKGIDLRRTIVANVTGCAVYQTGNIGFHIRETSNSVVVSGCRTFQITGPALVCDNSHELNVSSNIFCWHTAEGIIVRNSHWGTITGNNVIDTGSVNPGTEDHTTRWEDLPEKPTEYAGILLENVQGFTVTGNALFNWPVCPPMSDGIREDVACSYNNIVANNVNYYTGRDVVSAGSRTAVDGNVGFAERPHHGPRSQVAQSFRAELTQALIDSFR